jgi:hypothetical protein
MWLLQEIESVLASRPPKPSQRIPQRNSTSFALQDGDQERPSLAPFSTLANIVLIVAFAIALVAVKYAVRDLTT